MKKLLLSIIFIVGMFPYFEKGELYLNITSLHAQDYGSELDENEMFDEPCLGLEDAFNSSFNSNGTVTEQNGFLVTGPNGNSMFIGSEDSHNTGSSSQIDGVRRDPNTGDAYLLVEGQLYQIESIVHTHPNTGIDPVSNQPWEMGPSPSDQSYLAELNSLGGHVNGVILGADGLAYQYGSSPGDVTTDYLDDFIDDQC